MAQLAFKKRVKLSERDLARPEPRRRRVTPVVLWAVLAWLIGTLTAVGIYSDVLPAHAWLTLGTVPG